MKRISGIYKITNIIIQMALKTVAKVLQIPPMDILGDILNKRLIDYLEREYANY